MKIFELKIEKKLGVPIAFFQFLAPKFLFEFSGFYNWKLSRNTKMNKNVAGSFENFFERPENTNVKHDFRRRSWASFGVGTLPSSQMNIFDHLRAKQLSKNMILVSYQRKGPKGSCLLISTAIKRFIAKTNLF